MSQSADAFLEVAAGKTVFAEGDASKVMYIIESGSIDLLVEACGTEPIASLGPGDFFGELSVLDDQACFATAIARKPTRLLKVEREGFSSLLQQDVDIALHLLRTLAQRQQQWVKRLASAKPDVEAKKRKPAPVPAPRQSASKPTLPAAEQPSMTMIEAPAPLPTPSSGCVLRHAKGQVIGLDPNLNEFLVGRPDPAAGVSPEVDLSPLDPTRSLSRRHAKLIRQGQLFFVREESRTVNGTFVNNVRIKTGEDVPVKPGDKLRFGAVEIDFSAA
ncbi:MAG TPA: cyclic nucleotide-binding domain-containing protein [Dokdonella sp.]|uniref:cyclic nucleotide-binding domain-containing protein n=1 Tax=Dokdonella sp. TaxID=2291710 RepID=UPI002D8048B7|nr:cyclic nucleotide-binding domain-containing protein [Dokdonella sp.]HET9032483.1 cyclic nucleotide-binding domain-containing protein [Dokdonella sp.]